MQPDEIEMHHNLPEADEQGLSDTNALLCCEIAECEDVKFLRDTVDKLWQIIDDIDTMSDIAKVDDKFYRAHVEKIQKRRWELGINCDGYQLFRKAT